MVIPSRIETPVLLRGDVLNWLRPECVLRPPPGTISRRARVALQAIDLGRVEARTGYAWIPTPVPEQTGDSRFADATRHALGLGAGLRLDDAPRGGDHTELSIASQLQLLSPRAQGFAAQGHWLTVTAGLKSGF